MKKRKALWVLETGVREYREGRKGEFKDDGLVSGMRDWEGSGLIMGTKERQSGE
jgi:hypothetical protein